MEENAYAQIFRKNCIEHIFNWKKKSECMSNHDERQSPFEWAEDADYKYDSRDLSIPGLGIDLDPTHPEGFSCPVFFDRKVLGIFYNDSDYELDFFSESYGTIAEKELVDISTSGIFHLELIK